MTFLIIRISYNNTVINYMLNSDDEVLEVVYFKIILNIIFKAHGLEFIAGHIWIEVARCFSHTRREFIRKPMEFVLRFSRPIEYCRHGDRCWHWKSGECHYPHNQRHSLVVKF